MDMEADAIMHGEGHHQGEPSPAWGGPSQGRTITCSGFQTLCRKAEGCHPVSVRVSTQPCPRSRHIRQAC